MGVYVSALASASAGKRVPQKLQTENGPVRLWTPSGYDVETAGIVIYVHGYFTNVDRAWRDHRLPRQFAKSSLNALFIACEAPSSARDDVKWDRLRDLLDEVSNHTTLPTGRVVVVGHSGAHRTITQWLGTDEINTLVLVDGYYGDKPEIREWLAEDSDHRLIHAASDTRAWADDLHAELPETLLFDRFPPARIGELPGARKSRVVYVRSQYDHMSLVTGGVAIPMLLGAVKLPRVKP